MLGLPADTKNEAKCTVTHGIMGHLDPKQPPIKRKPFVSILNYNFIKKVELILPAEVSDTVQREFFNALPVGYYSRVTFPLSALLEADLFEQYIKKGILTLYLDKESYERAGLVGKPDGVKGKRGTKPRWVVEINLRLPSMVHGRKGFDRIVYAFKNILNTPVLWLFADLGANELEPDPLDIHGPEKLIPSMMIYFPTKATTPPLKPAADLEAEFEEDFEDFAVETLEWLSLVLLQSPRINPENEVDPVISRYEPPGGKATECKLIKVTWKGFIPPTWAYKAFVQALLSIPREAWFAFNVVGFGEGWNTASKDSTILKVPDAENEYILWEIGQ